MFFTSSLEIGPLSGELSLAQALEVSKQDREVAEGVSYKFCYISPPRCAPALFVNPASFIFEKNE